MIAHYLTIALALIQVALPWAALFVIANFLNDLPIRKWSELVRK